MEEHGGGWPWMAADMQLSGSGGALWLVRGLKAAFIASHWPALSCTATPRWYLHLLGMSAFLTAGSTVISSALYLAFLHSHDLEISCPHEIKHFQLHITVCRGQTNAAPQNPQTPRIHTGLFASPQSPITLSISNRDLSDSISPNTCRLLKDLEHPMKPQ